MLLEKKDDCAYRHGNRNPHERTGLELQSMSPKVPAINFATSK